MALSKPIQSPTHATAVYHHIGRIVIDPPKGHACLVVDGFVSEDARRNQAEPAHQTRVDIPAPTFTAMAGLSLQQLVDQFGQNATLYDALAGLLYGETKTLAVFEGAADA